MALIDILRSLRDTYGENNVRVSLVKSDGTINRPASLNVSPGIAKVGEKVIVVTRGQSVGITSTT